MAPEYIYKKVAGISFGLLSPKQIKKMATVKIVTPELYDKEGYPVDSGLMDTRLGVIDPGIRCKTCGEKLKECPGHFGYIELARPVLHVKYTQVVYDLLRSTCRECCRIMLPEEKCQEKIQKKELKALKTITKCPRCEVKQIKIKLEKPTTFVEADIRLSPIEVKARLEKIPNEDLKLMGINSEFCRPENMILTIMPIPPVTIRPSITLESGERSEDDLTHKLGDIVRINQRLFENINAGAPAVIIEDLWDLLQYHITTYFDNAIAQVPPARHRSGQALKTLTERMTSKEGRFRHNLTGKRVNYAARTVISPDPKIGFNEVGVPLIIAKELTIPEKVTEWNIDYLKAFLKRGPLTYPGANYVIMQDGKKKKITADSVDQLLQDLAPGCIVERHIINKDIAVFNRQPSLHKMSFMCHKIKVLPGRSFRLNPAICVAPDTKVQLSSGIQRKIDELKNCWKESELATFDTKRKRIKSTELKKFWGLKPEEFNAKCYRINTKETNRHIVTTGDHPFYTSNKIKPAKDLRPGNKVIVRPVEAPEYIEVDRTMLTKQALKADKTYMKHTLKTLEELRLLPLNLKDQRTMILARLLGHLFGDGTFILKEHVARLIFRGNKNDLEDIQEDIKSLGFKPEKIYIKTSQGEIHTIKGKKLKIIGRGASFEVRNKPLAVLFNALGAPNGDKVKQRTLIPKWIMKCPDYIKREFLAAYFGSELSSPALRQNSKTNFRTLRFKMSKTESNLASGISFFNQIQKLLSNFNIKMSISKENGNIRKDGNKTISIVASINSNRSQANLFGKIGYIYSGSKDNKARLAYQYLRLKEKEIIGRKKSYKEFVNLRRKGTKFKEISRRLNIPIGALENWAYKGYNPGLCSGFIDFDTWSKKATEGIEDTGLVWETIENIQESYSPFVYDITTTSETHNFFANGFLTKNCHPYNADFDGDEMNLHTPQTEEARAEAEILMSVQSQIITPKNGLNVIGCTTDPITGNYLLTREMSMSREEAVQLLYSIGITDLTRLKSSKHTLTGKEIFSALLPEDFDFIGNTKSGEEVIIKKGQLTQGFIDKTSIGEDNGRLIRSLYASYGEDIGIDILGKIFKLGIAVLLKQGFTTSISDTDIPEPVAKKNKEHIQETEEKIQQLIKEYSQGRLDAMPGITPQETLERMILQLLNQLRDKIGETVYQTIPEKNSTILMVKSGAKGSVLNIAQMAACVGQQSLRGSRIHDGYQKRTLSIFKKHSLEPSARGFIYHGYRQGLTPSEYFFHAMTGRDSLMDTALRTPKSGYLYRRLSNALQDLKVEYDGTVRDANKRVIQFKYGDDNIDVSRSEGGKINVKKIVKEVATYG